MTYLCVEADIARTKTHDYTCPVRPASGTPAHTNINCKKNFSETYTYTQECSCSTDISFISYRMNSYLFWLASGMQIELFTHSLRWKTNTKNRRMYCLSWLFRFLSKEPLISYSICSSTIRQLSLFSDPSFLFDTFDQVDTLPFIRAEDSSPSHSQRHLLSAALIWAPLSWKDQQTWKTICSATTTYI